MSALDIEDKKMKSAFHQKYPLPKSPIKAQLDAIAFDLFSQYKDQADDALYLVLTKRWCTLEYNGDLECYLTSLAGEVSNAKWQYRETMYEDDVTASLLSAFMTAAVLLKTSTSPISDEAVDDEMPALAYRSIEPEVLADTHDKNVDHSFLQPYLNKPALFFVYIIPATLLLPLSATAFLLVCLLFLLFYIAHIEVGDYLRHEGRNKSEAFKRAVTYILWGNYVCWVAFSGYFLITSVFV